MWTIFFKSLYWLCYNIDSVLFFGREACGILAPRPGIKPSPPALEGEVQTTGPPGKSPSYHLQINELLLHISRFSLP